MRVIGKNGLVYESIDYSYHLAHHGILGQKWGKQNGPPYPLGASDHSAAEKKAGWKQSLDGGQMSKRKLTKSLNKADKKRAEAVAYAQGPQRKADKLRRKLNKADSDSKRAKIQNKLNKVEGELNVRNEKVKQAEARIQNLISQAKIAGYDINSTTVLRTAATGKQKALGLLGVHSWYNVMGQQYKLTTANKEKDGFTYTDEEKTSIKKYRDAEDHFKEVMSGSPSDAQIRKAEKARDRAREEMEATGPSKPVSAEEKQRIDAAYNRAKNDDRWSLDFLEYTQNKKYAGADEDVPFNRNKMLYEYREFMTDAEGWLKKHDSERQNRDNVETRNNLSKLSASQRNQAENKARSQSVQNYARVNQLRNSGMSYAAIAKKLGISESTVWAMINEDDA